MTWAAQNLLPKLNSANKPWISDATLDLIELGRVALVAGDTDEEKRLHIETINSAKVDRTRWLEAVVASGDWQRIRVIRKPRKMRCGRLGGDDGELVENDSWADAMADHLERVQWHVRPLGAVEGPKLGPELPGNLDEISEDEVAHAVRKLRKNRAAGPDEIPAEFWQSIAEAPEGLGWLAMLCNKCLNDEVIPQEWHIANVACIQ